MKDSQQMSVDISSQNEMALSALSPPVSLKEVNNIYRADSVVADDENYQLNLTDDDESGEKKATAPDPPQESEDDILNKFDIHEGEEPIIANGCGADPDEKLEDRLLNDCIDNKEEESVNNTETSSEDRDLNNKKSVFSEEEKDEEAETKEEIKDGETKDEIDDAETKAATDSKMAADGDDDTKPIETDQPTGDEDEKKEESENVVEMKEKEDEEEAAERKEKENAELLQDQILDTEHLLQIVDQQDTVDEPNDNSCSGENTPDKDESDEAETDKNDEEEEATSTSKNDDDTVDIEEDSPYKGDFDSELDKEYEKIVNEKESEEKEEAAAPEKMEEEGGEKLAEVAPVEKTVEEEGEKDTGQSMDVTEKSDESTEETSDETKSSEIETETQTENSDAVVDVTLKTKRSLPEPETSVETKRIRLEEEQEGAPTEDQKPPEEEKVERVEKPTVTELTALAEYMQKNSVKRLTRADLEQFCLMKMCEAICHKSEIGELRHQLSIQEQMIDMWRKEAAALVKQARDLEIVNKRLLHEVRLKTDKEKPLIPVRITRSVGLQVRSDNNVMYNAMQPKRRFGRSTSAIATPTPSPQKPVQSRFGQNKASPGTKTVISKTVTSTPTNKQASAAKPKSITPKTPNSLLSKALQNSTAQATANSSPNVATVSSSTAPPLASISNTSTTPSTPTTTKSASNASPKTTKATDTKVGVIDLTDEDEKKPTTSSATTTTVNTAQGVRIVSTPVKNANSTSSANVVNPPRIMYLYNNQLHQGVITDSAKGGAQKVMFKLNSIGQANGVLTAVTTGSPITATNGTVRTNQVQPVRFSSPTTTTVRTSASSKAVAKHPAPLPPPPITQIGLAARKPIPPKPHLSIRRSSGGIVLSWKMPYILDNYEAIASYQLYAYQETTSAPSSDMWRKVGDVKALALPMACTLTQFADGNKYHFAVRAVDVQKRMGPFSDPEQILL